MKLDLRVCIMHSLWLDCTNLYPLGQRLYGDYFSHDVSSSVNISVNHSSVKETGIVLF